MSSKIIHFRRARVRLAAKMASGLAYLELVGDDRHDQNLSQGARVDSFDMFRISLLAAVGYSRGAKP